MAFRDNSGTIIIDAVLTDIGRKRMADGNFRVTKFGLGDDEVDYSLLDIRDNDYSKVKAQPVFEAFASKPGTINHGLVNYKSDAILYAPVIKVNEKLSSAVRAYPRENSSGGQEEFYYLTVNNETSKKLTELLGTRIYHLQNETIEKNKLFFESGIDEPLNRQGDIPRDNLARERYILNYNLLDKYFIINCDNRFIEKLLVAQDRTTHFENDSDNILYSNFTVLKEVPNISYGSVEENFSAFIAIGTDNLIFNYGTKDDNVHSAIHGPRGTICAINFKLINQLTNNKNSAADFRFSKFGTLSEALFGGSDKFDYIDTSIQIEGLSSGSKINIPLRILRYAGT